MSSTDCAAQQRNYITIKDPNPVVILSLNDVFKESMNRVHGGNKAGLIIRCESLPRIRGSRGAMENLFALLIGMIVKDPVAGSKRFLYIDCEEIAGSKQSLQNDQKEYLVKFYTNSSANQSWIDANRETINQCEEILSAHHGRLTVNNITNTGCLFSISLPGKFE